MDILLEWFYGNKEWIFSGFGVSIFLFILLGLKRSAVSKYSDISSKNIQISGPSIKGNINIRAGGDIGASIKRVLKDEGDTEKNQKNENVSPKISERKKPRR